MRPSTQRLLLPRQMPASYGVLPLRLRVGPAAGAVVWPPILSILPLSLLFFIGSVVLRAYPRWMNKGNEDRAATKVAKNDHAAEQRRCPSTGVVAASPLLSR